MTTTIHTALNDTTHHVQQSSKKLSICNTSFLAMFNLLHCRVNQQLFEKAPL